jgi:hypothetical protein
MADRGYFLLYRGWRQSEVFKDEPLTEREAWVWLIEEAAYKPRQRDIAGKTIGLQRGEIAASLTYLERAWKWSREKVRWFLSKLAKHGMVAVDKRVGITVILVCNYDHFQPGKAQNHPTARTTVNTTEDPTADAAENGEKSDTHPTANPTAHPTASTTNENEGLVKKGSNSEGAHSAPAKPKRDPPQASYIPEDWQPKVSHYDLGKRYGLTAQEVENEARIFHDHWLAESGQRARKRNWDRAFNTWLRKSAEYRKRAPAGKPPQGNRQQAGSLVGTTRRLVHGSGG